MGFYPNKLEKAFKQQYAVVMGQKSQLFFELTTEDTLRLFKEIYGIPEDEYKRNKDFCGSVSGAGTDECTGKNAIVGRKDEDGTDRCIAS